jgi:hypothetical protein
VDLVPPSTEQVLPDDIPGLVMRQAIDDVFDDGEYPYENPKYYGLEQDRYDQWIRSMESGAS